MNIRETGNGNGSEAIRQHGTARRSVPDLEAHLRTIRDRHNLTSKEFAKKAGISPLTYWSIETGSTSMAGKKAREKVIDALGEICEPDDPHAVSAVTLLTASSLSRDQRRRIQDLTDETRFSGHIVFSDRKTPTEIVQDTSPLYSPEMEEYWYNIVANNSFGNILKIARQKELLPYKRFLEEVNISASQLFGMENGRRWAKLPTVNILIDWLPFNPQEKTAQLFRLKSQRKDVLAVNELDSKTSGFLVNYVRIAHGLTHKQLAHILKVSESTVENIENRNRATPLVAKAIALWLQDEPINEIIQRKLNNPRVTIPEDMCNRVLNGKILFIKANIALAA